MTEEGRRQGGVGRGKLARERGSKGSEGESREQVERRGRSLVHAKGHAARGMGAGERRVRHGQRHGASAGAALWRQEEEKEN